MRLLLGLMWLLHWLPLPILGRLGEAIGALLFLLMRSRRNITLTNLRLCMPELDEQERRTLARRHFQAYARSILERGLLWWGSRERLSRLIEIEAEMPLGILTEGPTIMLCPHFVCLDVAGVSIVLKLKVPSCSMYTRQQNKVFDEALYKGRSRFLPVKLFSRADGIKPVIRAMREACRFHAAGHGLRRQGCRICAVLRHPRRHPDGASPPRSRNGRQGDCGDCDVQAELPGLDRASTSRGKTIRART